MRVIARPVLPSAGHTVGNVRRGHIITALLERSIREPGHSGSLSVCRHIFTYLNAMRAEKSFYVNVTNGDLLPARPIGESRGEIAVRVAIVFHSEHKWAMTSKLRLSESAFHSCGI
jgi:hypothetical protein